MAGAVERDLLPMPTGRSLDEVLQGAAAWGTPTGQRRKARRMRAQEHELRQGIRALNRLGAPGKMADEARPLTGVQRQAVKHMVTQFAQQPPMPPDIDNPLRAWKALQGTGSGYADERADGSLTTFEPGQVSLPSGASGTVDLRSVLPSDQQNELDGEGFWRDPGECFSCNVN